MTLVRMLGEGLLEALSMFWATLWALFLGFALSGAVQAFVSRARMQRMLGDHRPVTIARAGLWGMVSSSCSYAASALAKTLFRRGADFTTALVFMVASTNLVIEMGLVLWLLLGWQFALAELVGGVIMIALLALAGPRFLGGHVAEHARAHVALAPGGHGTHGPAQDLAADAVPLRSRLRSRREWSNAAAFMISDLTMIRRELVIGFVVAGLITAFVPVQLWQALFDTGHGFWSSLENALVGPLLAIVSFVCSVGNVPLAATLWHGGASFGGVVAFVFADLIALPLLAIYRGYFGWRVTGRILVLFWASMSAAGLAVEYLFMLLRVPAPQRLTSPAATIGHGFEWNHTTWLNLAALALFAVMYWLYRTRPRSALYAKDPVCGMQVEISQAPARRIRNDEEFFFCSDRCAHRFDERTTDMHEDPGQHEHPNMHVDASGSHRDPICGMLVNPDTAAAHVDYQGKLYYFCSPGCRTAFELGPEVFSGAS